MVDSYDFISGLWWCSGRYCSMDPPMQCTSVGDDRCLKETKRYMPTNTWLLEKTENQWLLFGWNWVPEPFVCPQSHQCLSDFIKQEHSAKLWNQCNHFEEFIAPKENISLSLKDNCFNTDAVTFQKLISCIGVQSFRRKNY